MTTPLFSTYSQGENRVTATFLAVLERLSVLNMSRILGTLLDDRDFSVARFINQPKGDGSIPDARIRTGHGILIETKRRRNEVRLDQIRSHLKAVFGDERLLVLTPDDNRPKSLNSLSKEHQERVVWSNFGKLDNIVAEILNDKKSMPSEMEAFLLREFSKFLHKEGLAISSNERVIVVSAGKAWPRYNGKSIYGDIRKPNWKPSDHLAFYTRYEIKPIVPRIKSQVSPINITIDDEIGALDEYQKQVVEKLIENPVGQEDFNHPLLMLFLSGPDDRETMKLPIPIEVDTINDKTGKREPLMMGGVRYVTLESLRNARYTSDLVFC